jgi:hypothetical protein
VVVAIGLAVGGLELGGPLGVRRPPASGSGSNDGSPIAIQSVRDFDPYGDGSEHPEDAPRAVDGRAATAWSTDHYSTAGFGRLKPGLGLWVGFGQSVQVGEVTITSPLPGWTFDLIPGAPPNQNTRPVASAGGQVTFTVAAEGTSVIDLGGQKMSGLMIWITRLAPDAGRYAASIGEITVREGS